MNSFDLIGLGVVLLFTLLGLRKGFAIRLVGLAALAAGLVVLIGARPQITAALESVLGSGVVAGLVAVPLAFLAGALPVSLIGRVLVKAARATPLRAVDALLGAVVGLAQGILVVVLVLLPIALIVPALRPALEESRAYAIATAEQAPWREALSNIDSGRDAVRDLGDRAVDFARDLDLEDAAAQAERALDTAREALPDSEEIRDAAEELRERLDD